MPSHAAARAQNARPNALQALYRQRVLSPMPGVSWVRRAPGITVIKRTENEGMDFAAHNTSMTYAMEAGQAFWLDYRYYVYLNSSIRGPLLPKYHAGHWSRPYTDRLVGSVKAVGASLVCLPPVDAGASFLAGPNHNNCLCVCSCDDFASRPALTPGGAW